MFIYCKHDTVTFFIFKRLKASFAKAIIIIIYKNEEEDILEKFSHKNDLMPRRKFFLESEEKFSQIKNFGKNKRKVRKELLAVANLINILRS